MKLFSLCSPPILSNLLVASDNDVPTRPRCQVTNHRRLNINLGFRHDTSLADLALTWPGMSRSNIRDERRHGSDAAEGSFYLPNVSLLSEVSVLSARSLCSTATDSGSMCRRPFQVEG